LREALPRGVKHGGNTVLHAEPDIGRASDPLAQDRARRRAKPRAAAGAAAVDAEKKRISLHSPLFRNFCMRTTRENDFGSHTLSFSTC
jgi:hypothetical protein